MHTLKIQESVFDRRHPVEVRLTFTCNGLSQSSSAYLAPLGTGADYRLQRWYFEEFRVNELDSELRLAQIARDRMAKTGVELFRQVFLSSQETRRLWAQVSSVLPDVRIELEEADPGMRLFPWELLRPNLEVEPIVLAAAAFVLRTSRSGGSDAADMTPSPGLQEAKGDRILGPERPYRALLVICRPFGFSDVEFRAVARPLLATFEERGFSEITFDVLRPPTFKRLYEVLLAANRAGQAYHIVHFDGHGVWKQLSGASSSRCYLAFEPEVGGAKAVLVPGDKLGAALNAGAVQLMIMNACRSAYVQHVSDSSIAGEMSDTPETATPIAYEVASAGIAGVVAMRYNVAVETATRFVVRLYEGIGRGGELAQIVSQARCLLASTGWPGALAEAWQLPVFVQNYPLRSVRDQARRIRANEGSSQRRRKARLDGILRSQDGGIVGQDFALLALDRIFLSRNIAALVGAPGSGKTALAMELAHWFAQTGGLADYHDSRAAPVIIYRDLSAVDSVDTLCESIRHALPDAGAAALAVDQLVSELTRQETLMILDLNNDISERRTILPEELTEFVRVLVDGGINVLFVARHLASLSLRDFSAIQLRYVDFSASYAIAAKWLSQKGIDDLDLVSQVATISGGLPGVIRWIADRSADLAETENSSPPVLCKR